MVLNSSRLIPALRSRYCGMVLYLSNSACQADASSGGTTPVTGFHSTIDRPDSVSRVAPPTTTVTNIRAATASSHSLMARRRVSEHAARLVMRSFGCRRRRGPYNQAPASANERDHAHPSAQARRRDHADRPGARLGALRDGARAIGCRQGQRHDRGDLLRGRRPRLGIAGDAAHSLDVATRRRLGRGVTRARPCEVPSTAELLPPSTDSWVTTASFVVAANSVKAIRVVSAPAPRPPRPSLATIQRWRWVSDWQLSTWNAANLFTRPALGKIPGTNSNWSGRWT